MIVNKKEIKTFGGKLLSYGLGGSAVVNDYMQANQGVSPVLLGTSVGTRPLTIVLTFSGIDRADTIEKISAFASEIMGKSEIALPDGFIYTCILTGISEVAEILPNYQEVSYTFEAVQHKEKCIYNLSTGTSLQVFCEGNLSSDCVFKITPTAAVASLKINGITIKNLAANKTFVIDGIHRTVTQDGINKFASTDLVEFPKLNPGMNTVTLSTAVPLTVSFFPTFI